MPLQPFRHPGVVDGAANVQSSIMNMQNIKQNDLLNLGKQAELDEFNATAGLRQNSYAAEDLQAGLKRVYTLGLLNNVNGIKQFASQWAQQGGPNSVVAQEIIENVDQDFQGMMGHLTPLFSDAEEADTYYAPTQATDPQGNPALIQTSKRGNVREVPGFGPSASKPAADPEKVRIADEAGLTGQKRIDFLLGTGEFGSSAEGGDLRSRKIADAMRLNPGLSEQQATKIVDGQASIKINDKTGKLLFTDDVQGTVTEVQVSGGKPEIPTPPPGQTLYDLADVATGPVSSLTAKAAAALSFFGIDTNEASTGAQQTFNTHTQALIRALAVNQRFPVGEMERIREEIDILPSFAKGSGTLKKKIRSLDNSLRVRLDQAERDFNDTGLDEATRQSQGANASALRNFLSILGGGQKSDATTARIDEIEARLEELRQGNGN